MLVTRNSGTQARRQRENRDQGKKKQNKKKKPQTTTATATAMKTNKKLHPSNKINLKLASKPIIKTKHR